MWCLLGKYDTILADYLIGAVDGTSRIFFLRIRINIMSFCNSGFSPYEQDTIISRFVIPFHMLCLCPLITPFSCRLAEHLNPNGMLFVIGMNPIPDHAPSPGDIIGEVRRARDSCILLAGHRPYRYPTTPHS